MVTRRRNSVPVETSKDTTKTKVVIPEGTEAEIMEQIGGKTVAYKAQVQEDESQNEDQNETNQFEDIPVFTQEPPAPAIWKSPLDKLFDDIIYCVENENVYDSFIAKLLRKPDNMNDKFNVPCRDFIDIGAFSFASTDRFSFTQAIQDANDNSGGRFQISIFTSDYKQLDTHRNPAMSNATQWHHREPLQFPRPVIAELVIPNPKPKPFIEGEAPQQQSGIGAVLLKMTEMMNANHNALMSALRQQPQKSELETTLMSAMVQKITGDIMNPPTNGNVDALQSTMVAMFTAPEMARKMVERAFPEPPPEREPTLLDQVKEVLEIPAVKDASGRVMDIVEAASVKGLKLNETTPDQTTGDYQPPQSNPELITMNEDQIELITTIVEELESENKLDGDNETLKELREDFPDQFTDLVAMCQSGAPFESVFNILVHKATKIQPFPFQAYLNVEQTQVTNQWVWNEQGEKIIARLRELYEYLKTVTP